MTDARNIADASSRADALAALAPRLKEPLLGDALVAATEIAEPTARAGALAAVAACLSGDQQVQVLRNATATAREILEPIERARALAALAAPALKAGELDAVGLYAQLSYVLREGARAGEGSVASVVDDVAPVFRLIGG